MITNDHITTTTLGEVSITLTPLKGGGEHYLNISSVFFLPPKEKVSPL